MIYEIWLLLKSCKTRSILLKCYLLQLDTTEILYHAGVMLLDTTVTLLTLNKDYLLSPMATTQYYSELLLGINHLILLVNWLTKWLTDLIERWSAFLLLTLWVDGGGAAAIVDLLTSRCGGRSMLLVLLNPALKINQLIKQKTNINKTTLDFMNQIQFKSNPQLMSASILTE